MVYVVNKLSARFATRNFITTNYMLENSFSFQLCKVSALILTNAYPLSCQWFDSSNRLLEENVSLGKSYKSRSFEHFRCC